LHGHTHVPRNEKRRGVFVFEPGLRDAAESRLSKQRGVARNRESKNRLAIGASRMKTKLLPSP
jgi:predicted phosphodiesterase